MRFFYLLIAGLSFHLSAWGQPLAQNDQVTLIEKILQSKDNIDFEFFTGSGRTGSFKYYLQNDSLWFSGTNLYTTVIPLRNIDFERKIYFLESSSWKNKTNFKCIEVPLYAIKGRLFAKEFEIEILKKTDEGPIDFANLILPEKALAEALIKYLKARRP